ncbi:MAG: hypothetical protein ACFFF4_12490, partial [Candidatus Thorarchaeota archaeon]
GRVFALIVSGATAMMPIGLALAGPLADIYGVPFWFIISGIGTVIVSVAASFSSSLRRIEEMATSKSEPVSQSIQDIADSEEAESLVTDEVTHESS